jgi:hypothetical protein
VIDATFREIRVTRELKILRRPVSADILDDGSILAVLSTDHQVNLYNLRSNAKHMRLVQLDNPPRTIALAPGGSVLAAAYDGGIEVYSLSATAMSTDRRAVKCDPVDSISFSIDGTMLLGTTRHSPTSNTVVLSAPYYHEGDEDVPPSELLSQMWTTQILFPNNSRDCSHATLLPQAFEGDTGWTFTYDRVFETFRAVRVDDLRNGTMYFTGPFSAESDDEHSLPSTLPTANAKGEVAAAGFAGNEIWLYGIPEDLEVIPDPNPLNGVESEIGSLSHSSSLRRDRKHEIPSPSTNLSLTPTGRESSTFRLPQWQVLCDKFKNVFIAGHHLASVDGMSGMRWVKRQKTATEQDPPDRLVAVAPGIVNPSTPDGDQSKTLPTDGGRIFIYDFEQGTNNGIKREITIELGDLVPEILEEERRDMEAEVAIVRRRTVAKNTSSLGRFREAEPARPSVRGNPGSLSSTRSAISATASVRLATGRPPVRYSRETPDIQLEGPYTPGDPRSRSLLRAATVASNAATTRNRRNMTGQGPGGHRDPPHESDADNWTPPPPPYTEDSEEPLPDHLLLTLLPRHTEPIQRVSPEPTPGLVRARTNLEAMAQNTVQRARTTATTRPAAGFERDSYPRGRNLSFNRSSSSEVASSTGGTRPVFDLPGTFNLPHIQGNRADLYEVTPSSSPVANGTAPQDTSVSRAVELGEQRVFPIQINPESESIDQIARNPTLLLSSRQEGSGTASGKIQQAIENSNAASQFSSRPQHLESSNLGQTSNFQLSVQSFEMDNTVSQEPQSLNSTLPNPEEPVTANFSRVQPSDPVNLQPDSNAHLIPEKPTVVRPRRSSSLQNHQRPDVQLVMQAQPQKQTGRRRRSSARSISSSTPTEDTSVQQSSSALPQSTASQAVPTKKSPIDTLPPAVRSHDLEAPMAPSPEQMAALQSRYSSDQPRSRPSSLSRQPQNPQNFYNPSFQPSSYPYTSSQPQGPYSTPYNPQVTPSPPRAAAGAAGQPHQGSTSPKRSSSGRNASRFPASSTTNVSRPDLRRLDTIHSITSQHSENLLSAVSSTTGPTSANQNSHPPRTSHGEDGSGGGDMYISTSKSASNLKAEARINKPLPQLQQQQQQEQQQQYLKRPRWKLGRGRSEGSASASASASSSANAVPTTSGGEESWEEVTRKWKVENARSLGGGGGGYEKKRKKDRDGDRGADRAGGDRERDKDGKCAVM